MTLTITVATDNGYILLSFWNFFERFFIQFEALSIRNIKDNFNRDNFKKLLQEEICTFHYKKSYINHLFGKKAATLVQLTWLSKEKVQLFDN